MLIIFEGVDGSGKSTYMNELEYALRNTYDVIKDAQDIIPTRPNMDRVTAEYLIEKVRTMATDTRKLFLMDRGPISDIVYRLFDDYYSVIDTRQLLDLLIDIQKYVIIVYADTADAFYYMQARGDTNKIAIENHENLRKTYNIFFTMLKQILPFNVIDYDFADKDSVKEADDKIALWAKLIMEE